ncbi:hypothetical protein, partial [Pseudomonas tremae]|uniref:hypothetical protein n=1 Tax=Pseudomonas tremae TaxID=200454 RepID=UPI001F419517
RKPSKTSPPHTVRGRKQISLQAEDGIGDPRNRLVGAEMFIKDSTCPDACSRSGSIATASRR